MINLKLASTYHNSLKNPIGLGSLPLPKGETVGFFSSILHNVRNGKMKLPTLGFVSFQKSFSFKSAAFLLKHPLPAGVNYAILDR